MSVKGEVEQIYICPELNLMNCLKSGSVYVKSVVTADSWQPYVAYHADHYVALSYYI